MLIAAAGVFLLGRADVGNGYAAVLPVLLIGLGASIPWGLMDGLPAVLSARGDHVGANENPHTGGAVWGRFWLREQDLNL